MFKKLSQLLFFILLCTTPTLSQTLPAIPDGIWVRPGYELTLACKPDKGPRHMNFGPDGTLYFSQLQTT